jgi:hypothetical protein
MNCQSLVSLTLASREVPVMVGLRLFLRESWTEDPERMARARVPEETQTALTKPEIAIEEIDRVIAAGARLGCVLADAGSIAVACCPSCKTILRSDQNDFGRNMIRSNGLSPARYSFDSGGRS